MEGFKNTRKGTNIAAQATAIGLATVIFFFLVQELIYYLVLLLIKIFINNSFKLNIHYICTYLKILLLN